MAITLNGTTGITTPDITSDSYTGPLNVSASAPDDSLVVNSAGNVGVGTSSPNSLLHLSSAGSTVLNVEATGNNDSRVRITAGNSNISYVEFADPDDIDTGEIRYNHASNYMGFHTNGNVERARISAIGNLLVGLTTNAFNSRLAVESNAAAVTPFSLSDSSAGAAVNALATWYRAGSLTGSITVTGTTTAYNTSSDYRLKEDWQPMTGASERVKALKPVNFAWKLDGSRVDGFLAHEAQEVVPEAVHGTKDAMRTEAYEVTPAVLDDDGNITTEAVMGEREVPDYQGIDQSKLVPLLTAALQEALTKIDALTARIEALENNIV